MGIVVYGIVEAWMEITEYSREHWEDFAEISFNKNHSFIWALNECGFFVPERDWIKDRWRNPQARGMRNSLAAEKAIEQDIWNDSTWVSPEELSQVLAYKIEDMAEDGWKLTPKATLAFMQEFRNDSYGYPKIRLLVYRG